MICLDDLKMQGIGSEVGRVVLHAYMPDHDYYLVIDSAARNQELVSYRNHTFKIKSWEMSRNITQGIIAEEILKLELIYEN